MSSEQTAVVIVAAVIVLDGKVLLKEITNPEHQEGLHGKWELPGGAVNLGESFDAALQREVKEELGLGIQVGRLLHSQINTYSTGTDYLVLYYACTLLGVPDWEYCTSVKLLNPQELRNYDTLPGTVEAIGHLGEVTATTVLRDAFSFVRSDVSGMTSDETLHVMTYELGHLIELHHKCKRYGSSMEMRQAYRANARKEMADMVSMNRMYCEQMAWDFDEVMKFGETAYLERMEDLRKHGAHICCTECGRILPMHDPSCSQNEKMY